MVMYILFVRIPCSFHFPKCCSVALRERRCIYRDFTGMPCGMDAVVTGYRRVTEQHLSFLDFRIYFVTGS